MDNMVNALRYYDLILYRNGFEGLPQYALPNGYRFAFYEEGDRDTWIAIATSAREFLLYEEGLEAWNRYFAGKEEELTTRMVFIVGPHGEKVGTATAFYEPEDPTHSGWLHWVSIRRDFQGRGLARPLIAYTLARLRDLGYTQARIPTQTTSWLAVKLYLDFGFVPLPENARESYEGYRMMRTLTNHPSLAAFPPVPEAELWDPVILEVERQLQEKVPDLLESKVWSGGTRNKVAYRTGNGVHMGQYEVRPDASVAVFL